MSAVYDALDDQLIAFIRGQKLFFVATAPLSAEGCVNLSPKGYDTFAIIDRLTVAYLDLGGSGAETIAHVRENGRITLMFCAFEGRASILRLYGHGEVCPFDAPDFAQKLAWFPSFTRARSVVTVSIERIADSCGWGVPIFEFVGEREQLRRHVEAGEYEDWAQRRLERNAVSIDALPADPFSREVE